MRQMRLYYANLHTFGHYKTTIILVNFDNLCIQSYTSARQKKWQKVAISQKMQKKQKSVYS